MQEMNVAPLTMWIVNGALHNKGSNGLVIDQEPIVQLDQYDLFHSV